MKPDETWALREFISFKGSGDSSIGYKKKKDVLAELPVACAVSSMDAAFVSHHLSFTLICPLCPIWESGVSRSQLTSSQETSNSSEESKEH